MPINYLFTHPLLFILSVLSPQHPHGSPDGPVAADGDRGRVGAPGAHGGDGNPPEIYRGQDKNWLLEERLFFHSS